MRGVDKVRKVEKGVRFVVLRGKWLYIFVFFSSFLFHTGIQLLVKKCHLDKCTSFIHLYKWPVLYPQVEGYTDMFQHSALHFVWKLCQFWCHETVRGHSTG